MNQEERLFCNENAHCTESMLQVSEHVSLRVLNYVPVIPNGDIHLVMVGGLSTIVQSFRSIIYELTRDFPVHYVETREKPSSQINGNVQFDIETMGQDLVNVIRLLGLEDDKYILMGNSFGATTIVDCLRLLKLNKPRCLILIQPNPVFIYPIWALRMIRTSVWILENIGLNLRVLLPFAKWYMIHYVINRKEDPEMALIFSNAVDHANPLRLRKSILSIANYEVWDKLDFITCPTLIVATSKDKLHLNEEITKMALSIKNCSFIDLETNQRSHSAEMARIIRDYVNQSI